jgi:hypothetical protein
LRRAVTIIKIRKECRKSKQVVLKSYFYILLEKRGKKKAKGVLYKVISNRDSKEEGQEEIDS